MLIHIVEAGETIYGIAPRYGVSPARLLSDNGLHVVPPHTLGLH